MPELVIVGGGNMGSALLSGLVESGWAPSDLAVLEPNAQRQRQLRKSFAGVSIYGTHEGGDNILLAVKPVHAPDVCRGLAQFADPPKRLLSIVAGLPCSSLENWLGQSVKVLRAMPNLAATVGASATALCAGLKATEADLVWAEVILSSVGSVVRIGEQLMDAVTGVSGSGPAYLMLVAEAMVDAAVACGISGSDAASLVRSTFAGACALLDRSGMAPQAIRAAITSPAGTTAAGLRALEDRAVRAAFMAAVEASAKRASELGAVY